MVKKPNISCMPMDTASGEIVWKESLGVGEDVSDNRSGAPMIYEGNIYVGSPITEAFYAYDLKTGERSCGNLKMR